MSIVSITGLPTSGKDTVGNMLQFLVSEDKGVSYKKNFESWLEVQESEIFYKAFKPNWKIKKIAEPLKQCTCIILGCTMEQLESQEFKASVLPEKWWKYKDFNQTKLEIESISKKQYDVTPDEYKAIGMTWVEKPTVREFLQKLGTEVGRNLHPNTWVNSLVKDYVGRVCNEEESNDYVLAGDEKIPCLYPNWIITDLRYNNEYKVLKSVEPNIITLKIVGRGVDNGHSSNHGLDNHKFDYTIQNIGTLENLFKEVRFFKEAFIDGHIKQEGE